MKNVIEIDGQKYDGETGELINEVEQVEVEIVEDNLPEIICNGGTHIVTNTEQLKKELDTYLKKYDIEVTEETEKESSKVATELNKLATELNKKRVAVGKEIKKPADLLKKSVDELIEMVQEKRTSILDKVEVFKTKRFELIRELLEYERDRLFAELNVSEEYQFLDIEPLVKEGSLAKTNLTKTAKESLLSMVRNIKALEDAVKIRTLELKVKCIDAGLEFPIELDEVKDFIKDDNYDERLSLMIESRLKVEKQLKEKAQRESEEQKARQEQFRKDEAERLEREKQEAIKEIQREAEEKESQRLAKLQKQEDEKKETELREKLELEQKLKQQKETGKKKVLLNVVFEIEVGIDIEDEKVKEKYQSKINEMFSTLKSIDVI